MVICEGPGALAAAADSKPAAGAPKLVFLSANTLGGRPYQGTAESKLKGVPLRIWPLNPTANGRNFNADLAKTVPAAETAKQGFSAVTRKKRLSKGTN